MQQKNPRARWSSAHLVGLFVLTMAFISINCGQPAEDGVGFTKQSLYSGAPTGDRGRLLWEATRAVVGINNADSEDWSPVGEMFATASYVSTDTGAWSSLRNAAEYAYGGVTAYYVSCRADNDTSNNYTPCSLTKGSDTVSEYECQNGSCSNNYHGGQCKAFANLVAYRSGIFHGTNWAWKSFPSYAWISSNCSNTTSGSIQAGDVLVYPNNHTLIVARVFSSTSVMVIDSNWVRPNSDESGNGYELIGAHEMSFSGSGLGDLDNYKVLNCVYNNDCTSSCN